MATKKQLVELLKEYVESTGAFKDDDPIDYNDEEDFDFILHETLDELGACKGCRWYFDADRSCEKTNDCNRTCVNRLYKRLMAKKSLAAVSKHLEDVSKDMTTIGEIDWDRVESYFANILRNELGTDKFKLVTDKKKRTVLVEFPPVKYVQVDFVVKSEGADNVNN